MSSHTTREGGRNGGGRGRNGSRRGQSGHSTRPSGPRSSGFKTNEETVRNPHSQRPSTRRKPADQVASNRLNSAVDGPSGATGHTKPSQKLSNGRQLSAGRGSTGRFGSRTSSGGRLGTSARSGTSSTTPPPRPPPEETTRANGKDKGNGNANAPVQLSESFCLQVHQQLQELVEDPTRSELSFPKDLDNTQRRFIHSLAEKLGLFSKSNGKKPNRFIHVAKVKKTAGMQRIELRLQPIAWPKSFDGFVSQLDQFYQQFPMPKRGSGAPFDAFKSLNERTLFSCNHSNATGANNPVFAPIRARHSSKNATSNVSMDPVKRALSEEYQRSLPVFSYRDRIIELVHQNPVVVISGDTGCGKSTQIPQFLLDDALARHGQSDLRIICTQPRRLSAISLAERVAKERNGFVEEFAIENQQEIGYAVRFDACFHPQNSKLIFVTTGTLVKWLLNDPFALGMSHLILDEVHERDCLSDFLLILLKTSILPFHLNARAHAHALKVVLMSATIQVDKFAAYFDSAPCLEMHGRMFPVKSLFLEEILLLLKSQRNQLLLQGKLSASAQPRIEQQQRGEPAVSGLHCELCGRKRFASEEEFGIHVATCFGEACDEQEQLLEEEYDDQRAEKADPSTQRQMCESYGDRIDELLTSVRAEATSGDPDENVEAKLVNAYMMQQDALRRDSSVDYDLLVRLLTMVDDLFYDFNRENQSILVFLPGWEEISQLDRKISLSFGDYQAKRFHVTMLHSRLSPQEQRQAFRKPPKGTRKLILSTNIAETSVTIDDVVFVVDCGKSKQVHFIADASHGEDAASVGSSCVGLQTKWISKANCAQRSGRAGRVMPGICLRLFSKTRYEAMAPFMTPDLLVTPLEQLLLDIKLLGAKSFAGRQKTLAKVQPPAPSSDKQVDQLMDPKTFLLAALDPPPAHAIDQSIERLKQLEALDAHGNLTSLGLQLAQIGLPPQIGRMVLMAHLFGVLDLVLWSCCALGFRDPFECTLGMTKAEVLQIYNCKTRFLQGFDIQSDHFVMAKVMETFWQLKNGTYGVEQSNSASRDRSRRSYWNARDFCNKNGLRMGVLDNILSIWKQTRNDLVQLGYPSDSKFPGPLERCQHDNRLVTGAFLFALGYGLYPNLLYVRDSMVQQRESIWQSRNFLSKQKFKVRVDGMSMVFAEANASASDASSADRRINKAKRPKGRGPSQNRGKDELNKTEDQEEEEEEALQWVVFHEMTQSERTRMAQNTTKLPSLVLLLFVGNKVQLEKLPPTARDEENEGENERAATEERVVLVIDEWIVFEMPNEQVADQICGLRTRLLQMFRRFVETRGRSSVGHQELQTIQRFQAQDECLRQLVLQWFALV